MVWQNEFLLQKYRCSNNKTTTYNCNQAQSRKEGRQVGIYAPKDPFLKRHATHSSSVNLLHARRGAERGKKLMAFLLGIWEEDDFGQILAASATPCVCAHHVLPLLQFGFSSPISLSGTKWSSRPSGNPHLEEQITKLQIENYGMQAKDVATVYRY